MGIGPRMTRRKRMGMDDNFTKNQKMKIFGTLVL
jgi:hypothetical protein